MNERPDDVSDTRAFVFPDPLYRTALLDGAAFLFFREGKIAVTSPPTPGFAAPEAEVFLDVVNQRQPDWKPVFHRVYALWDAEGAGYLRAVEILQPLEDTYSRVMIAVPADLDALERSEQLITAAQFSPEQMDAVIDPICASGELLNHIMLEMWLHFDGDVDRLYAYCGELFSDPERVRSTLHRAYLFRVVPIWRAAPQGAFLLNNERILPFFLALPVARPDEATDPPPSEVSRETVTWEIFRQLLNPFVDPISPSTAELLAECRADRSDEIDSLKRQCERLAEQVQELDELREVPATVEDFIRLHVADDVADLLRLNEQAKAKFLESLLTDRGVWVSVLAGAHGTSAGSVEWTAAGVIGGIATLGSKGYAALADRKRRLETSDYRLIFRVAR